ncbi:MAG: helix-turn-helix domain-containing protein [Pseudomonadota bacterium]
MARPDDSKITAKPRHLGVSTLAMEKRLKAWTEAIYQSYYPLDLNSPAPEFVRGELSIFDLPGIRVGYVDCDPMVVERRRCHLDLGGDYFLLPIPLADTLGLQQHGRETLLQTKEFGLIATTDSYKYLQHSANKLITLRLNGALLRGRLPLADDLVARPLRKSAPMTRLFVDFASRVCAESTALTEEEGRALEPQLLDLLALALTAPISALESDESAVRLAHLRRLYRLIDLRSREFGLTLDRLCQDMGLSARYLQRMLAARGQTFSGLLREQRLARAKVALADPARRAESIASIGYSVGFADPAHFSRSFRSATGRSPKAFRAETLG